ELLVDVQLGAVEQEGLPGQTGGEDDRVPLVRLADLVAQRAGGAVVQVGGDGQRAGHAAAFQRFEGGPERGPFARRPEAFRVPQPGREPRDASPLANGSAIQSRCHPSRRADGAAGGGRAGEGPAWRRGLTGCFHLASISTAPHSPIMGRRFSPGERGILPPTAWGIVVTDNQIPSLS